MHIQKTSITFRTINKLAIPATIAGIAEPLLSITDTAIAVNPGTTLWVSQSNLSLSGLLSIIAFLRPNAFRNRRADWLQQFKSFAEGQ